VRLKGPRVGRGFLELTFCIATLDSTVGAYSAPSDPIAGFKGPTSKGREGKREKR